MNTLSNSFQAENRSWIEKAEKKANEIISQIKKSFDKVVVGKAIWKLMSIPGILFGRAVVVTPKATIKKVQRIENKVWRYLLGIGGYSTVESLRGDRSLHDADQNNGNDAPLYCRYSSK